MREGIEFESCESSEIRFVGGGIRVNASLACTVHGEVNKLE